MLEMMKCFQKSNKVVNSWQKHLQLLCITLKAESWPSFFLTLMAGAA